MGFRRGAATLARRLARPLCSTTLLSPALTALRTKQREELRALEILLVRLSHDDGDVAALRDAMTALDATFLICAVGEFNAGKSSLINALLASEHCKTGVLPTTADVTLLNESDATAPWLRDVSIVDTPGTNTLDQRHTSLTRDFVPRADVLLFVTSAERPFSESEHKFLTAILEWGKKVAFVINKADLLPNEGDLAMVMEHVASNAQRELGSTAPVFPVSSRTALTLKRRAAPDGSVALGTDLSSYANDEAEARAAAQWEALEAHVLSYVQSDTRALEKLHSQRQLARAVHGRCEAVRRQAFAQVVADLGVVEEARRRVDAWEGETRGELDAQRARMRLVLLALKQRGVDFLGAELELSQMLRLLLGGKSAFVERFHAEVLADASEELQRTAQAVASWMEQRGAAQARSTSELLQARLGRAPAIAAVGLTATARLAAASSEGGGGGSGGEYSSQRHELLLQLQGSGRQAIDKLDPRAAAERLASAAQASLAQAALLQASAAGVTSLVAVKAAALVDLTGLLPAALLAATGLGLLPVQRYRLQREFGAKVDVLATTLDRAVTSHLEAELVTASGRASQLITPFSTLVKSAHTAHEEQLGALTKAREALDALDAEARVLRGVKM